ncbi:L-serine ammonia-lyase [Novosphingobium sp. KN65.2]|uniref:L-serine ammonia-lyase n=1 Tax=Novosphingobium sp. KN65.2 TaxID=1478134 RepID=UPI0005E056B1|nr:L-serine ammonia-lyase [Novosphingobium sp. KN65.2]CDO37389.1 L-serine dehydratase [Novosphingobium sp. KN65.2]
MISALDLFRIGLGPSSSHTVGPMRIATAFLLDLRERGRLGEVARVRIGLQGSLALTGEGHGTPDACIIGLCGFRPETVDPEAAYAAVAAVRETGRVSLLGEHEIGFAPQTDLVLDFACMPDLHPNGMVLCAYDAAGAKIAEEDFYSTGGGFFSSRAQLEQTARNDELIFGPPVRLPFGSGAQLLEICARENMAICEVVLANEAAWRPEDETMAGLDAIAQAMNACIDRGLSREGQLPGELKVRRRARSIHQNLIARPQDNQAETLMDWLNLYAMAVNEENASGGRVVTAPTNGAAGIIPALLRQYCSEGSSAVAVKARRYLLTAAGIGMLYKQRASISGAEMGCQGEVGVACSMAAAGLAAVWGGTPEQVTAAAEIGMEHNLGLTCDPVGGLVQIPCIERNAIAAVKAVNAAKLALHAGETPRVSLDQVIETMRQTGVDMSSKYKETSQGGLAINVVAC